MLHHDTNAIDARYKSPYMHVHASSPKRKKFLSSGLNYCVWCERVHKRKVYKFPNENDLFPLPCHIGIVKGAPKPNANRFSYPFYLSPSYKS